MSDETMTLQSSVSNQRAKLNETLYRPMRRLADACQEHWGDRAELERLLQQGIAEVPYCKYLYVLDAQGQQVTANASKEGLLPEHVGRDRSDRNYFREATAMLQMLASMRLGHEQMQVWPVLTNGEAALDFFLSGAYISQKALRPSLTAFVFLRDQDGQLLGMLGADFALRDLPESGRIYTESRVARQFTSMTSAGANVPDQSKLDQNIDTVISVLEEMILVRGVFHVKIHFTSSQTVVWSMDEPFRYRILSVNEITNPNTCLAYPKHEYPQDAIVPKEAVRTILQNFKKLRSVSGAFNLRSSSLNIFNGIVGLTFASQNSHYLPYEVFLDTDQTLWERI